MKMQEIGDVFDIDPQITVLHTVAEGRNGRTAAPTGTETTASGSCGPSLCLTMCSC